MTRAKARTTGKFGTVAIIGRPNVGKSTLLNLLIKFKLSAISPKPQTTRHKMLGVLTGDGYQIAFLDTPGLPHRTRSEFDRRLTAAALEGMEEADVHVMLVEPRRPGDVERRIIQEIKRAGKPVILAINKIDLIEKPRLLPIIEEYARLHSFAEIVPISAAALDGIDRLLQVIVARLPEGEPMFSPDEITDRPERFLAGEIIREQIFNVFAQEIPYAVAVEIEGFHERSDEHAGKDHIEVTLYVDRESQKAILIGRGGEMLKRIGTAARQNIEALTERPAFLELWVKVYPDWQKDKAFLERIGY